jgi:hypothetical protein
MVDWAVFVPGKPSMDQAFFNAQYLLKVLALDCEK